MPNISEPTSKTNMNSVSKGTILRGFFENLKQSSIENNNNLSNIEKLIPRSLIFKKDVATRDVLDAVEAFGEFLVDVSDINSVHRSKEVLTRFLPIWYRYCDELLQVEFKKTKHRRNEHASYILSKTICKIAINQNNSDSDTTDRILSIFEDSLANRNSQILRGILRAFSEFPLPMYNEKHRNMTHKLGLLVKSNKLILIDSNDFLEEKYYICNFFKQLASSDVNCNIDDYQLFQNCANQMLHRIGVISTPIPSKSKLFLSCIQLLTACALNQSKWRDSTIEFIESSIKATLENYRENYQETFENEPELKALFTCYSDIVVSYSTKSSRAVDFLVTNIIKIIRSFENSNPLTDMVVDSLCKIIKTTIAKGDLTLVNGTFTALYTPFFVAHDKYVKLNNQSGAPSGRVSRSVSLDALVHAEQRELENLISMSMKLSQSSVGNGSSPALIGSRSIGSVSMVTDNKAKRREDLLTHIVHVIGNIIKQVNNTKVTELILDRLLGRIYYPPKAVDRAIIDELVQICLLGQEPVYHIVIAEFLNIFRRVVKDTDARNITDASIVDALLTLAKNLPQGAIGIRQDMMERLLKLFIELGKDVKEKSYSSPLIQGQGYLLPIMAQLLSDTRKPYCDDFDLESSHAKLIRTVWFYCILFAFAESDSWRTDWFEATRILSQHVPILISRTLIITQISYELNALINNGLFMKDFPLHQELLVHYLPGCSQQIRLLSHAQVLYVLSIYHLETLRSSFGTFHRCLVYLEFVPNDYPNSQAILDCFQEMIQQAFVIFASYLQTHDNEQQVQEILNREVQNLLFKCCSFSVLTRSVASRYLFEISQKFPHITWDSQAIFTLFDLIGSLSEHSSLLQGTLSLPKYNKILELPDNISSRQLLLNDLIQLASKLVSTGFSNAPVQTQSTLHEYVNHYNDLQPENKHHVGLLLAMKLSSAQGKLIRAKEDAKDFNPLEFTNNIGIHAFYMGEVRGLAKVFHQLEGGLYETKVITSVKSLLINNLVQIIQETKIYKPITDLNDRLHRGAAFLIDQKQVCDELLNLIIWTPVLIFTEESLTVGCSVWTWLFTARPELSLQLLHEIADAWKWTVTTRIGLFSDAERYQSPLSMPCFTSSTVTQVSDIKPLPHYHHSNRPHRVWLTFLEERFVVASKTSREQMAILSNIISTSIENPKNISVTPSSGISRFVLLRLCFQYLKWTREDSISRPLDFQYNLLKERAYCTALHWFELEPTWYRDPYDYENVVADVRVLTQLSDLIEEEDRATDFTEKLIHRSGRSNTRRHFLHGNMSSVKKLLLLLLGNAIDRIITWTNPQQLPDLTIPMETKYTSTNIKHWSDYIETAWKISPKLCLQLKPRFPQSRLLQITLERKVVENAQELTDIPEAIPFLVTPASIEDDLPEFKYLLYWSETTPTQAIGLLHASEITNMNVIYYAIRVLKSYSPATMMFYIPQLIQSLRYDVTGLVYFYLLNFAKQSELIAHQLLWNLETYYKSTKESVSLREITQQLSDHIIENMNDNGSEFSQYEREFRFFGKITNISKKLLKFAKTKEERQALLVTELKSLNIPNEHIYLPTNPDISVHGIDANDSKVLQSAAKAPIAVTFKCHRRDHEFAVPENSQKKSSSIEEKYRLSWKYSFKQSVIFKYGDDIRQDMLAVQLIELFKRIFQEANLDLFLHPYKVITTKPECGMIEMVPKTMSRDQIGKKIEGGIVEYFHQKYGPPNTESFQTARKNFIKSMAGYSIVCYLLQIKDRHNGNILFDEEGHIIHIDFGFIFNSSPGSNIGWELAPFKLTGEMIHLMGGLESEVFRWFMDHTIKGFLAVREYSDSILTLVKYMLDTQLPCFRANTLEMLKARMVPEENIKNAANFYTKTITNAFSSVAAFTTFSYDQFQKLTQNIEC